MINVILIDDEKNALKGLALELVAFQDTIKVLGSFTNSKDALKFIEEVEVDAVFLDMEMPVMNGLTFLDSLEEKNFEVIFTTAHSRYAIDAVKSDAVDYLLKPIGNEDLAACIERLEKRIAKNNYSTQLIAAIDKLSLINNSNRKVKLQYDGKINFFSSDELVYFEGNGNYTNVHLADNKKILLTRKLKQLEEELPEELFFRIHNSYIVNLSKIKSFHKNDGLILLEDATELPVSKQRRTNIINRI